MTLVISMVGGAITGMLCSLMEGPELFDDREHFMHCEVPNNAKEEKEIELGILK